ncbi:ABC transporter transmembrane domain-containing protein [Sphingomonas turrisvirgatae]|uniref:ABC transmembrane type-1 domain-containing protein n=1 Tax=Sphingomonas turrisvirgatae TaxID=1888892 RepID=A0A1E3LYX7_9SPHN|nr:ABC transporter transmembrane domain-containing protein [Sphingomonas turrisvirgatae]ODP39022.1 hypothetical protein BFL28_12585 [Sphingomonas turrisvirgatae]
MTAPALDPALVEAVATCLAGRDTGIGDAALRAALGGIGDAERLPIALADLGVEAQWLRPRQVDGDMLPVVTLDNADFAGIADDLDTARSAARCLAFGTVLRSDMRAADLVQRADKGWFWPTLWQYRRYYFEAAALSAVINVLSLAGIIFMMTVYDRILPNLAFVTLWSLLAGVGVALLFEFVSRTVRGHALDSAGKKIDLILGDAVFSRVLATRLENRAQSSGAFANIIKEFESVRSFVSSATLVAIADLPFALLFLLVAALIGGPLVFVPVIALILVAGLSLLVQIPMARLANENLREAAVRHGTVIESLEGIETLKALRAEGRMRRLHEHSSGLIAERAARSQSWSNLVLN